MTRIVMDSNVAISAIVFGGKPRQVLDSALRGNTQLCISEALVAELRRVLLRPKFCLTAEMVETIISELVLMAVWAEPQQSVDVVKDDPDDNMLLECALASYSDCIVTGDSHLLNLGDWKGIKILTADRYIEDYLS